MPPRASGASQSGVALRLLSNSTTAAHRYSLPVRLAVFFPGFEAAFEVVDGLELMLLHQVARLRAAAARGAMHEIRLLLVERIELALEVLRVEIEIRRARDVAGGVFLRRAHVEDDHFLVLLQNLRGF